jgi:hypothetical protein
MIAGVNTTTNTVLADFAMKLKSWQAAKPTRMSSKSICRPTVGPKNYENKERRYIYEREREREIYI